jgi:hypothetical protein
MRSSWFAGLTLVNVAPDAAAFQSAPIRLRYEVVTDGCGLLAGGVALDHSVPARILSLAVVEVSRGVRDIRPFLSDPAGTTMQAQLKNRRVGIL